MIKRLAKAFESPLMYVPAMMAVMFLCLSYWTYLCFNTEMAVAHDAIGYENAGRAIFERGWQAYFEDGPQREPLYLFTIAASMKMGELFSLDYQHFQRLIQVILLFFSQLLLLYILDKLRVCRLVKVLTVLYFGISPAIVNAAFSLYSEIIAFPFVLLAVILLMRSWQGIYDKDLRQVFRLSLSAAVCLLVLSLGKGVFRYVLIVCLLPFAGVLIRCLWDKDWDLYKKAGTFIIMVIVVLNVGILGVKALNKKHNGQFTYTGGRYNYIVLGSAIKRTRPLTKEIVLSHAASVPGTGVCKKLFSDEACEYADWFGAIEATSEERARLLEQFPEEKKGRAAIDLALAKMSEHPFRFLLFTGIESLKMFFWESTRIGYVQYPSWLDELFTGLWLRYGLRAVISLLTIAGYLYLFYYCFRERRNLFKKDKEFERQRLTLLIFIVVTVFIGIYAACYVITRYALPIAGLFLAANALCLDRICATGKGK